MLMYESSLVWPEPPSALGSTCPQRGAAATSKTSMFKVLVRIVFQSSRYDDGVLRLNADILVQVLSLNEIFVVEVEPGLGAVRILTEQVDAFGLGKIPQSSSQRDG